MDRPKIAIVRGKFLNAYEMQFYEPLHERFDLKAFASQTSFHDSFVFPVEKLWSPMDIPDFPYKMPVLNRMFVDAQYLFGLEEKLKGYDIAHSAEMYYHYTQQCLNAKKRGYVRKVIASVQDNILHNNEGIWGRKSFKKRAREELDAIVAISKKTKDVLIAEGVDEKKVVIIHRYVDTSMFVPSEQAKARRARDTTNIKLLFVGRLEQYKGVFDVVDVLKCLKELDDMKRYDVSLAFVGKGSKLAQLRRRVARKGLDHIVSFTHVSYTSLPQIYDDADVLIVPSRSTDTWSEQYGNMVLLEAQSAGVPIVTTDSGGIRENVGTAGIIVPEGDIAGLVEATASFITSPKKREIYSKKARNRALLHHDVTIGAKKLTALYDQLLS